MRHQRKSKYKSRFHRYNKRSRLKGTWTLSPIEDLVCFHSVDLEAELSKLLMNKILGKTNEETI
jgi:hypothetical protein